MKQHLFQSFQSMGFLAAINSINKYYAKVTCTPNMYKSFTLITQNHSTECQTSRDAMLHSRYIYNPDIYKAIKLPIYLVALNPLICSRLKPNPSDSQVSFHKDSLLKWMPASSEYEYPERVFALRLCVIQASSVAGEAFRRSLLP